MTATKHVKLPAQIAAADREIAMRRTVYPRQVEKGLMTQEQADQEIANMEAIRDSLVAVRRASLALEELRAVLEAARL